MYIQLQRYFFAFILLFLLSCEAPHNNPLDPENPDNKLTSIEGTVKTVKVPQIPLSNTEVFWVNDGIIAKTDSLGYFLIENVNRENGWLIFEKEDYTIDSIYISFDGRKTILADIFLNARPKIVDLKFYSITTNKFPTIQKYNLEVSANIIDEENDIDSVFIVNEELGTRKELLYNASSKLFKRAILLEDLNLTTIDFVIGKDFDISVIDNEGKHFLIGNSNIKRIIKEEVETSSPSGRDTIENKSPFLEWRRFQPGFSFKYFIEIYTDELPALLVWQKELSSDLIEYQTDISLPSGDYFWVIWAIDEFENRTRSKPSSFVVN